MNEFDAIAFIVDTAVKHAKHNQKLHGRRGNSAGIDTSTWKAHKPSVRALALAEEFAAMASKPETDDESSKKYEAIKKIGEIEQQIQNKFNDLKSIRERLTATPKVTFAEKSSLFVEAGKIQNDIDSLITDRNDIQRRLDERLVQLDSRLMLRDGRSDIAYNTAMGEDPNRRVSFPSEEAVVDPEVAEYTNKMIAAFHSITGGSDPLRDGKNPEAVIRHEKSLIGGYYDNGYTVVIGLNGLTSKQHTGAIVVHELAHVAERRNPKILEATFAFYEARTVGEQTRPLNEIWAEQTGKPARMGPFPPDAIGRRDNFSDIYSGREYLLSDYKGGRRELFTTEVFSSGVEWLLTDPVGFAKADPEYFTFVVDTVQNPDMYN